MSLTASLILASLASTSSEEAVEIEPVSREELVARMTDCSLSSVEISYSELLLTDIVSITDAELTDGQLECIADTGWLTGYFVEVSEPFRDQYQAILNDLWRPELLRQARLYFAERPELGPPPERLRGESDHAIAMRIEAFCGPMATGAFTYDIDSTVGFSGRFGTDGAIFGSQEDLVEALKCLDHARQIANLRLTGVRYEEVSD